MHLGHASEATVLLGRKNTGWLTGDAECPVAVVQGGITYAAPVDPQLQPTNAVQATVHTIQLGSNPARLALYCPVYLRSPIR